MRVERLDHIHIYSEDPEASARFYVDHFEAREVERNTNRNGDLRVFLTLGHQILVPGSFPHGMGPKAPPDSGDGAYVHGFGVSHFGLRVQDVDAAVAELLAAEVKIFAEPLQEDAGLKYAYIAAPDGVVIELTQYEIPAKKES